MASKNYANVQTGWSQADQRNVAIFRDQHKCAQFPEGRPWWANVERAAEGAAMPMPVGELMPLGWDAPWFPDAKYINASIGRATPGATLQEHKFRIDYAAMIADCKRAMREYYDNAITEAIGQGWQAPDYGAPIPYRLRAIVGKGPPLSPKVPEAALAEDPWILGFSKAENETLARLLQHGLAEVDTAEQSEVKVDKFAEMEAKMAAQAAQIQALLDRATVPAPKVDGRSKAARAARTPSQASAE
jgi:hypothetical protein